MLHRHLLLAEIGNMRRNLLEHSDTKSEREKGMKHHRLKKGELGPGNTYSIQHSLIVLTDGSRGNVHK